MPAPFIVFALPRSRTAWMSCFLSHEGSRVGHDIAVECKTGEDFLRALVGPGGLDGTVETGAMLGWRLIRHRLPEARLVVVKRPVWQVQRSLAVFGLCPPAAELFERSSMLDSISGLPGTLTLAYDELSGEAGVKELFEFCLERPFDREWWECLAPVNIQIDMEDRIRQLALRHDQLEALKADIILAQRALPESLECHPGLS